MSVAHAHVCTRGPRGRQRARARSEQRVGRWTLGVRTAGDTRTRRRLALAAAVCVELAKPSTRSPSHGTEVMYLKELVRPEFEGVEWRRKGMISGVGRRVLF